MPAEPHYSLQRRVQFAETDMAGVLHFSNYFRLMEEVEHAFWRSHGRSVVVGEGADMVSWPRVAVRCEYRQPVRFEDELELRFFIREINRKSLSFEVEFICDGKRVAAAYAKTVCCRMQHGRFESIEIPPEIRAMLPRAVPAME